MTGFSVVLRLISVVLQVADCFRCVIACFFVLRLFSVVLC